MFQGKHMPLGHCKLKQDTTHLLEWPNANRQHQMLTRIQDDKNSHSLLIVLQNGIATLEGSLAVS